MKELKKFHLRPEQELSDEEMKQIKAGVGNEEQYYNCSKYYDEHNTCITGQCIYQDYSTGNGDTYIPRKGSCLPKYDFDRTQIVCECVYP